VAQYIVGGVVVFFDRCIVIPGFWLLDQHTYIILQISLVAIVRFSLRHE